MSEPGGRPAPASCPAVELIVNGRDVAHYVTCPDLGAELSPRPYLHPVRTASGIMVTDAHPADHQWHLGISVALQDVAGNNFWGGPTYARDRGYEWHDDHGHVQHERWVDRADDHVTHDLLWIGAQSDVLLHERRSIHVMVPTTRPDGWLLAVQFTLTNSTESAVALGSPGTHGRRDAGYGGFFWRLPRSAPAMTVGSPAGEGERAVHGRTADWLAVTGHAANGQNWSVLLVAGDDVTANDPWFVRVADYPAIGSALAFDKEVVLQPSGSITRTVLGFIVDGSLSKADCVALHREMPTLWARKASV